MAGDTEAGGTLKDHVYCMTAFQSSQDNQEGGHYNSQGPEEIQACSVINNK